MRGGTVIALRVGTDLSSMKEYVFGFFPGGFTKTYKPVAEQSRWSCSRFLDVKPPVEVLIVPQVDTYPSQTTMLLLLPRTSSPQSQPVTSDENSIVAIDVEALLCTPTQGPSSGLELLISQAIFVGQ